MGTELAKQKGIDIKNPKFRHSIDTYFIDKENNAIYKGIASVKFLNENCSKELYIRKDNRYNSFMDLLIDLEENSSVNSKQMKILIELDFFEEFGKAGTLMDMYEEFSEGQFKYKKTYCQKTKDKRIAELLSLEFEDKEIPIKQQLQAQAEFFGSPTTIKENLKGYAYILDIETKHTPKFTAYGIATGKITTIKVSSKLYKKQGGEIGDIIGKCKLIQKNKMKKVGDDWVETEELEWWLTEYQVEKIGF